MLGNGQWACIRYYVAFGIYRSRLCRSGFVYLGQIGLGNVPHVLGNGRHMLGKSTFEILSHSVLCRIRIMMFGIMSHSALCRIRTCVIRDCVVRPTVAVSRYCMYVADILHSCSLGSLNIKKITLFIEKKQLFEVQ